MLERHGADEMSGVLSLGLLSEGMVLALGRAFRGEPLTDNDRRMLNVARRLFELMTEQDVIVVDEQIEDRMLTDESYLDALHVVQLQAEGGEIEASAQRYVGLLQKLLDEGASDGDEQELASLRDLFIEVGETTLSRADELSRTRQEPTWRPMLPATSRF